MDKPKSVAWIGFFCSLYGVFSSILALVLGALGTWYWWDSCLPLPAGAAVIIADNWRAINDVFNGISRITLFLATLPIVAVLTQRRDDMPTQGNGQGPESAIRRGSYRGILNIYETPDERSFGLYESAVTGLYRGLSKISEPLAYYVTCYYWISFRNLAHGLCAKFGRQVTDVIHDEFDDYWDEGHLNYERPADGIWKCRRFWGPLKVEWGYQVYTQIDKTFQARPLFTVRFK